MVYNHISEKANGYFAAKKIYYTLKMDQNAKFKPPEAVLGQNSKILKSRIWRTNDDKKLKFSGFFFLMR